MQRTQLHCHANFELLHQAPTRFEPYLTTVVARVMKIEVKSTETLLHLWDGSLKEKTLTAHLPSTSSISLPALEIGVFYDFIIRCRLGALSQQLILSVERVTWISTVTQLAYHVLMVIQCYKRLNLLCPYKWGSKGKSEDSEWGPRLLELLGKCTSVEGLSVDQMFAELNLLATPPKLLKMEELQELIRKYDVEEGRIYSTTDDQHYALTPV